MSRIADCLRERFPDPALSQHYIDLIDEYLQSGLAPPHVATEIMAGNRGLYAHLWEAMLYRHLVSLGFEFRQGNVRKAGRTGRISASFMRGVRSGSRR